MRIFSRKIRVCVYSDLSSHWIRVEKPAAEPYIILTTYIISAYCALFYKGRYPESI